MTNTSNDRIGFYVNAPSLGERAFDFDLIDADGRPARKTQYMKAARGEDQGPGPHYFITGSPSGCATLEPGETYEGSADLNKIFELNPGTYTVHAILPAYIMVPAGQSCPRGVIDDPKIEQEYPLVKKAVKSNTITLTVTK
jgi:hypothetical protein